MIPSFLSRNARCFACLLLFAVAATHRAEAQTTLPLTDLSFFQNPAPNWRIAGNVFADLKEDNSLQLTEGTGILVNYPDKKNKGVDLFTSLEHGDADIELDYMMAKGSNSGIYLQGRYEVQLLDSWRSLHPKSSDNGGIYERWDDSRPAGQKGYGGIAPRQNVSRAPGLWQHLKISFQAPRFDAGGRKTENAKLLLVELNGIVLHENVELQGPTRGPMSNDEKATGPLRLQGDHGAIAFRNIRFVNFNKPRPELTNLKYTVYKGMFEKEPDYAKLPPEAEGPSVVLTSGINNLPDSFLIRYTGTLKIKEPGEYSFQLIAQAGIGSLKINNQQLNPLGRRRQGIRATLPAGDLPFELLYAKFSDYAKPSLGLRVAGPGIREFQISDANIEGTDPVDPIPVHAPATTLLRSFMDLPEGIRVVHAISVGSAEQVHYTYDMDNGMLLQVWRGNFLDATPMWHERGDGSSRPAGSVVYLGKPMPALARLSSPQAAWLSDTAGTSFRTKGYILDSDDRPSFRYLLYGTMVTDASRVLENGQGFRREISLQNAVPGMYARLAEGKIIETLSNGVYLIDDKKYYLRIDDGGGATPIIRDANGRKELIIPIQTKLTYSLVF